MFGNQTPDKGPFLPDIWLANHLAKLEQCINTGDISKELAAFLGIHPAIPEPSFYSKFISYNRFTCNKYAKYNLKSDQYDYILLQTRFYYTIYYCTASLPTPLPSCSYNKTARHNLPVQILALVVAGPVWLFLNRSLLYPCCL